MRETMKALTETTLIPVSLVIVIVAAVWLCGHVTFQTDANARDVLELKAQVEDLKTMKTDIAVIRQVVQDLKRGKDE